MIAIFRNLTKIKYSNLYEYLAKMPMSPELRVLVTFLLLYFVGAVLLILHVQAISL